MKRFKSILVTAVICSLLLASCTKDDNNNVPDNTAQIQLAQDFASAGTWRITNFNDSGKDETSHFTGYNFTFGNSGMLTAINGTNTLDGSWSVTDESNSGDDSNNDDDIDFNIFFPVPDTNDFEDLNDDWHIVSTSTTKIELIDVSGGNGGTDLLTFEKN